jgi:site-specific recombinase XerD
MEAHFTAFLFSFSRKAARSTARHLRHTLAPFRRFLEEEGAETPPDLSPALLVRYFAQKARALKPTTLAYHRWAVRGFLSFLLRDGFLLVNPWPDDLSIKSPQAPPRRIPTPSDALRQIAREGVFLKSLSQRNRAIFELAYGCGLRRGELMRLNLENIREDDLRILGKGGKERVVPLGKKAAHHLFRYLNGERRRIMKRAHPGQDAVFLSRTGARLGEGGYDWLLKRYRIKGKPFGLHTLRHACATHMLEGGASLPLIQKLLGHAKLDTTAIYTRVEVHDLKAALSRSHPRK